MICQEEVIRGLLADRSRLLAYIRAIVLTPDAAEDIHQDIVVVALESAGEIADRQHLLAWARKVAKAKAMDYLRRKYQQPQFLNSEVLELLESDWETEWQTESPVMADALNICIHELSPRARKMLDLRFRKRMNGTDISRLMGLKLESVHTAFSRIYRALDHCIRQRISQIE